MMSSALTAGPKIVPAKRTTLDGQDLKILVEAALIWLKTNQQLVNSLNVFPVPDGDTGKICCLRCKQPTLK